MWSQKTSFSSKCWYFRINGQKTTFSKWSQNNVIFLEMLIFFEIWAKNYFLKIMKLGSLGFFLAVFMYWYWLMIWSTQFFGSVLICSNIQSTQSNAAVFLLLRKNGLKTNLHTLKIPHLYLEIYIDIKYNIIFVTTLWIMTLFCGGYNITFTRKI